MFKFEKQDLQGVYLIKTDKHDDERGYFSELYKQSDFLKNNISSNFKQDNFSYSKKNVLRGLHFQEEGYSQSKLVRVLNGEILDVIVDLRPDSKTFKQYNSYSLNCKNANMLYIPKGFAHGFLTLSDSAIVLYKTDEEYAPGHEKTLYYNDPSISINWNISSPILSPKDQAGLKFEELFK